MLFLGECLSPALGLFGVSPKTSSAGLFLLLGPGVWVRSSSISSGSPSISSCSFWASSLLAASLSAFSFSAWRTRAQSLGCWPLMWFLNPEVDPFVRTVTKITKKLLIIWNYSEKSNTIRNFRKFRIFQISFVSFNNIQIKQIPIFLLQVMVGSSLSTLHLQMAWNLLPVGSFGSFSLSANPSSQNTALPSAIVDCGLIWWLI